MDFQFKSKIILIISLLVMGSGFMVMTGWVLHVAILQSLATSFSGMRFNSALCFLLLGSALLLRQYQIHKYNKLFFFATVICGTIIGAITLLQDLFHFNSGLDQFFITDQTNPSLEIPNPGRMAFNAAFSFVLLGLGFLSLSINKRLFVLTSQYLFHFVAILSSIALIGYLYGVSIFNIIFMELQCRRKQLRFFSYFL